MKYEDVIKIWEKGRNAELNYFFNKFIFNSIRIGEMESRINQDYKIRKRTLNDILEQE